MEIIVHPLYPMVPGVASVRSPLASARLPLREIFGCVAEFCAAGELARLAMLNRSLVDIIDRCDWDSLTRHHFGVSALSVRADGGTKPQAMFRHMLAFWTTIKRDIFGTTTSDSVTLPRAAAQFFSGAQGAERVRPVAL